MVDAKGGQQKERKYRAAAGNTEAVGHKQLGGVEHTLATMVKDELGYKYHWAVADYLQRAARHIASKTDVEQAYAVGKAAVEMAIAGKNAVMPAIIRGKGRRYSWKIVEAPLAQVANVEKMMPRNFINKEGFGISELGRDYFEPLIQGEDYPPYGKNGLPEYVNLKRVFVDKKIKKNFII